MKHQLAGMNISGNRQMPLLHLSDDGRGGGHGVDFSFERGYRDGRRACRFGCISFPGQNAGREAITHRPRLS